jgi:origin recognition complex subunit 1
MPPKTTLSTPRQKAAAKAAKTRKILKGANLRNSDDEDEDQPWEWIYEKLPGDRLVAQDSEESTDETKTPRKRKARNAKTYGGGKIVGARKGKFQCKVGDAVCLKSDGGQTWAAVIWRFCEMDDEDGYPEKAADFLCRLYFNLAEDQLTDRR